MIVPWSILHFPYVKAAILSTYNDEPCGPCTVISHNETNLPKTPEEEKEKEKIGNYYQNDHDSFTMNTTDFPKVLQEDDNESTQKSTSRSLKPEELIDVPTLVVGKNNLIFTGDKSVFYPSNPQNQETEVTTNASFDYTIQRQSFHSKEKDKNKDFNFSSEEKNINDSSFPTISVSSNKFITESGKEETDLTTLQSLTSLTSDNIFENAQENEKYENVVTLDTTISYNEGNNIVDTTTMNSLLDNITDEKLREEKFYLLGEEITTTDLTSNSGGTDLSTGSLDSKTAPSEIQEEEKFDFPLEGVTSRSLTLNSGAANLNTGMLDSKIVRFGIQAGEKFDLQGEEITSTILNSNSGGTDFSTGSLDSKTASSEIQEEEKFDFPREEITSRSPTSKSSEGNLNTGISKSRTVPSEIQEEFDSHVSEITTSSTLNPDRANLNTRISDSRTVRSKIHNSTPPVTAIYSTLKSEALTSPEIENESTTTNDFTPEIYPTTNSPTDLYSTSENKDINFPEMHDTTTASYFVTTTSDPEISDTTNSATEFSQILKNKSVTLTEMEDDSTTLQSTIITNLATNSESLIPNVLTNDSAVESQTLNLETQNNEDNTANILEDDTKNSSQFLTTKFNKFEDETTTKEILDSSVGKLLHVGYDSGINEDRLNGASSGQKEVEDVEENSGLIDVPLRIIMHAPHFHADGDSTRMHEYLVLKTGSPDHHRHLASPDATKVYRGPQDFHQKMEYLLNKEIEGKEWSMANVIYNKDESPGLYGEVADYWRGLGSQEGYDNNEETERPEDEQMAEEVRIFFFSWEYI